MNHIKRHHADGRPKYTPPDRREVEYRPQALGWHWALAKGGRLGQQVVGMGGAMGTVWSSVGSYCCPGFDPSLFSL